MKIYTDIQTFKAINPVVTIGTFDGVHNGHKKVIARLKELAGKLNGESVVFTFYPHPRQVLNPGENNLRLLTTPEEKIKLFEKAGIDHLIIFPFTKEFSNLSYSDFVKTILVDKIHTRCLVVGYDHKFGKGREGGYDFLKNCAEQYNFKLEKLDALAMDDVNISSTKIRAALQNGDIDRANEFLGYNFTLHGIVVGGQKIGRKIQFPTANIEASDPSKIIPGYGVYAVTIGIDNVVYNGMLNIGTRPTVNNNADQRSIEVHIFDFDKNIYGEKAELRFFHKMRDERKFSSIDALKLQLENDKKQITSYFTNLSGR